MSLRYILFLGDFAQFLAHRFRSFTSYGLLGVVELKVLPNYKVVEGGNLVRRGVLFPTRNFGMAVQSLKCSQTGGYRSGGGGSEL